MRQVKPLTFALAALALLASIATVIAETKAIKRFSDWTVYSHETAQSAICFATGRPRETEPKGLKRDQAFFYVSAWPRDGVKAEVSVKTGIPLKKGTPVTAQIGNESFQLFTKDDKAFVADPTSELKLIEALKKGSFMSIRVTSADGQNIRDTYSLIGLTAAMTAVAGGCK